MKVHSWYVALGIVSASAILSVGCSSSSSTPTNTGDDASTADANTPGPDAAVDTGAPDAGDAAVTCDVPDGSDACDTCTLTSCCAEETTCAGEATNDAGSTDCADIFSCVQDCVVPPADSGVDAGTLETCTPLCSNGKSAGATADFAALATCLANNCATACN